MCIQKIVPEEGEDEDLVNLAMAPAPIGLEPPPPEPFREESDVDEAEEIEERLLDEARNEEMVAEAGIFNPPLYLQRYDAVIDILTQEEWLPQMRKVVDFGCAEGKLLRRLRKALPHAREIIGVDADDLVLEDAAHWNTPIFADYLCRREHTDLNVHLMRGSVGENDQRLVGADAVVAVELLEHLYDEDLSKTPSTIFGFIRPKLVIFTTPNREFNSLFREFRGPFRHWDHKFEWSRQEFRDFCEDICQRFPYSYEIGGVGKGPEGTAESHGPCSQMAKFVRRDVADCLASNEPIEPSTVNFRTLHEISDEANEAELPYDVVGTFTFPRDNDDRSPTQKLLDELTYTMRQMAVESEEWASGLAASINLSYVMGFSRVADLCTDQDRAKTLLIENGFSVVTNEQGEDVVVLSYESSDEIEEDDDDSRHPDTLEGVEVPPSATSEVDEREEESWE